MIFSNKRENVVAAYRQEYAAILAAIENLKKKIGQGGLATAWDIDSLRGRINLLKDGLDNMYGYLSALEQTYDLTRSLDDLERLSKVQGKGKDKFPVDQASFFDLEVKIKAAMIEALPTDSRNFMLRDIIIPDASDKESPHRQVVALPGQLVDEPYPGYYDPTLWLERLGGMKWVGNAWQNARGPKWNIDDTK